jgi:hypothetical protein
MENGITGVASAAGVSTRRVSGFLAGLYDKNGQRYPIKHVRYSTIERFTSAFSETPAHIYHPSEIENYRPTFNDARVGPKPPSAPS